MSDAPLLEPDEVVAAGRDLPARFRLALVASGLHAGAGGSRTIELECHEILRLLPGRRLVARVHADGTTAVMKLFLGRRRRRYRDREARGCRRLAAAGVATPALLGELQAPGAEPAALGLLFEYLADARPVSADDDAAVAAAAAQLGRLHRAGFRYDDLHLDNFLLRPDGSVHVIDGDGVRAGAGVRRGPGVRRSLEGLAVLCAQRPPPADERLAGTLRAYAAARGWPAGDRSRLAALTRAVSRQRRLRVRRFLDKAQRDCTEFHQHRQPGRWVVAVREAWDRDMADFAAAPEHWFRDAELLKDGNSATVVRARIGTHSRVIKRYNLKSRWHAMRRALQPVVRYRLAWLNGQRLRFLGIPTARPLALVECRVGPWRGVAYLVMEDLGDEHLGGEVERRGLSEERLQQIVALFRALSGAGLTHGDTKATNFLITPSGISLVDLDAMREGRQGRSSDVKRFLANFDAHPQVRRRLAAALTAAEAGSVSVRHSPEG